MPFNCAFYRAWLRLAWKGPRLRLGLSLGRALHLGLSLGCALACSLDCFGAKSAQGRPWGESSLRPFLGTSSFCIAGKKIPNVVGFGTFPNVVGFPSLQTVPRIEAALSGALNCAFYRHWLRLGSPLGCALACSLDCFALGRAWGESSLGPFFGNVVVLHSGKEDS